MVAVIIRTTTKITLKDIIKQQQQQKGINIGLWKYLFKEDSQAKIQQDTRQEK